MVHPGLTEPACRQAAAFYGPYLLPTAIFKEALMHFFPGEELTTVFGLFELFEVVLYRHQVGIYPIEVYSLSKVSGFFFQKVFVFYIIFPGYGLFYCAGPFFEFPATFGWGRLRYGGSYYFLIG